jgi:fructan beta-fructosidase
MNRQLLLCLACLSSCTFALAKDARFNKKHLNYETYTDIGYDQKFRPQFHFTSRKNWLNDPNGMVFYDDEYHLFFQHHALKNANGTKSWGHAVSTDMLQWTQLEQAIVPYKVQPELIPEEFAQKWDGEVAIWSGTTVVDHKNVLGKQLGDTKTLVAFYTATARPEFFTAVAYSTDKGRTFNLLNDGSIVVPNQGLLKGERDPKVFWHEPTQKYVLLIWIKAGEWGNKDKLSGVRFFTSENLVDWTAVSDLDRKWFAECMDLVPLPVDGDPENTKWVLYDASFDYEIGSFDGENFVTESATLRGDYGFHYYAAQTFNDMPDGRQVMIGWLNDRKHSPFIKTKMPFDQQMSIPTDMTLRTTDQGIRLYRWPVKEIEKLYTNTTTFKPGTLAKANAKLAELKTDLIDFSIECVPSGDLLFDFRGLKVTYNHKGRCIQLAEILNEHHKNKKLPAPLENGVLKIRALVDRASIEIFINDGAYVGSYYGLTDPENHSIQIQGEPATKVNVITHHELKSIWEN